MIERTTDLKLVRATLKRSRVVALLGSRQSGKPPSHQFVAVNGYQANRNKNALDHRSNFVDILWINCARHAGHAGKWGIR